jgi:DedD protein
MAKAISDEELQLKKRARRRLVGAIALVLLVVVFLPMFLDSEPKPLNQDIAITIPPIPAPETAASPPASPAPIAGMPNVLPPPPEPSAPKAELPEAEPAPAPTPTPTRKPETRPAPTASADAYVVQLGAFSNAANARALRKKLQENKFKAYTELVKSPGGSRTRVRVGPYASREAADKARDQLKARKLVIGDATVVRQGD